MGFTAHDFLMPTSLLPQGTGLDVRRVDGSKLDGQQNSQAAKCGFAVGVLAASLSGEANQAGRLMHNFNGCFDFVAMLSAGTTVASSANQTTFQELFIGKRSRMQCYRDRFHYEVTTTWIRSSAGIRCADPDAQSVAEAARFVEQSGCKYCEVDWFTNANAGAPSWYVSISRLV